MYVRVMGKRTIRFRVERNRARDTYWYTLVAGNGNTIMTSKTTYSDRDVAKRAARNLVEALQSSALELEYTTASGQVIREGGESVSREKTSP